MTAQIIDNVTCRPVPDVLLEIYARHAAFDTRIRVALAVGGYPTARLTQLAQGQLWKRLAEWGERQ